MKNVLQLFLWTCTALFLGILTILTMSALRGNINKDTLTKIVALLNGIDIQGERLRNAVEQGALAANESQQPRGGLETLEPISSLQTDLRSASLDRYKKELDEREAQLQKAVDRHKALVAEFNREMERASSTAEEESLQQIREILEVMEPVLAKEQIVTMLTKDRKDDVLAILQAMDADKLKKILGEFTDIADQEHITEILDEIRLRGQRLASGGDTP